jgi:hypothetical protein
MKNLKRFNESKKDKVEISELIKRKNDGEKLTDDEMYLVHSHFYKTSKEYKDHFNKMIDKLLKK